jgi:hypothetical protein
MFSIGRATMRNVKRRPPPRMIRRWVAVGILEAERRVLQGRGDIRALKEALRSCLREVTESNLRVRVRCAVSRWRAVSHSTPMGTSSGTMSKKESSAISRNGAFEVVPRSVEFEMADLRLVAAASW